MGRARRRVALSIAVAVFLTALVLPAAGQQAVAEGRVSGRVTTVRDGDTIEVLSGSETLAIRLHGVDAPESAQPGGIEARRFVRDLVQGRSVQLEITDVDRYGRQIAIVHLGDGRSLNERLVAAGHAWWYRQYAPRDEVLAGLEERARASRLGLWAAEAPIAPWDWRARGRLNENEIDRDCGDFQTQAEAQRFFLQEGGPLYDRHQLDRNRDGIACESLP